MDSKPGVYACLRCKARKIKCDRGMPKCTPCERAQSACLTMDPASGRQVPRGYISHLESRVKELEAELMQARRWNAGAGAPLVATHSWTPNEDMPFFNHHGPPGPGSLQPTFGPDGARSDFADGADHGPAHGNPLTLPVDLPSKADAERLIKGYFERCNAIVPVVHREQFITTVFEPVYGPISPGLRICSNYTVLRVERSSAEPKTDTFYRRWVDCSGTFTAVPEPKIQVCLFFLYMVFSLGIVTDDSFNEGSPEDGARMHAAAMTYYASVTAYSGNQADVLRSIQALLLRAVYGLIVPSHPSAWYATGTAMRMCIKLSLHNETRLQCDTHETPFMVDMRRRIFWSVYYMDRIISVYLGRPVNIGDEYIDCGMPSMADDSWIMPTEGLTESLGAAKLTDGREGAEPSRGDGAVAGNRSMAAPRLAEPPDRPSYKWVFYYMLALRRIQHATKANLYDRADYSANTDVRAIRDKIVTDLEEWYDALPRSSELFNYDFNLKYMEVCYYYTLMLLFRSSRGIPNPTVEETRRMLSAGTRVLTMYVTFHDTVGFVYSWAAIHNVLHASSSCLFGLYRTNVLDDEYDLNAFEHLMEKIMTVVNKLKTRYDASPSAYGPLHTMMRVTLDFLRARGDEPWRKRAKVTSVGMPAASTAATKPLPDNTDGVQAFPESLSASMPEHAPSTQQVKPQEVAAVGGANASFSIGRRSSSAASSGAADSAEAVDKMRTRQLLSPIGPLGAGDQFESAVESRAPSRFDSPTGNGRTTAGTTPTQGGGSHGRDRRAYSGSGSDDHTHQGPPLHQPQPTHHRSAEPPYTSRDVMQPMIVPRAVSESLAPMIPGYSEDAQYNELQVYDILDEISQSFDGYVAAQPGADPSFSS